MAHETRQNDADSDEPEVSVRVIKIAPSRSRSSLQELLLPPQQRSKGVLEPPPLKPTKLANLYDLSGLLRPNVDAYMVNIDSQGHHFEPAVDLNAPDADDRVRDAMFVDALLDARVTDKDLTSVELPDDEAVEQKMEALRRTARLELALMRSFFSSCTPDGTFTQLRRATREDLEVTGNAYWEVLRDPKSQIPRSIIRIPSSRMRIAKQVDELVVRTRRRVTDLRWETVKTRRCFHKFAEVDKGERAAVWFKEWGDPRLISRKTGKVFRSEEEMRNDEGEGPDAEPATEILRWQINALTSVYGQPRWVGNIPAVLGSRELDETNLDYFTSNAVPALALLCAGGRFGKMTQERLKEFFEEEVRGRRASHKLIVLEAEMQRRMSQGATAIPKIEFVPLKNAQLQDAQHQNYDERNARKVSASFRMPASLVKGSLSDGDLRLAENQVFGPERDEFDAVINKQLVPELGVQFWEFKSNTGTARDPETAIKLLIQLGKEGFLVPAEIRKAVESLLRVNLPPVRAAWAAQPMPLTLAAFGLKAGPAEAVREQSRQQGDSAPADNVLSEVGLNPEEAAVTSPKPSDNKPPDVGQAAMDALQALEGMGVGGEIIPSGDSGDGDE